MHAFAKKPKGAQQTTPAKWPKSNRAFQGQSREVQPILHLQRTIGNQGVLRFLRTMVCDSVRDASPTPKPATPVQPKLDIGEYDDQYEQEADQVAEQVMKMPAPPEDSQPQPSQYSVQRKPFTPGTQHPPGFAQLDFFSHAPQGSPPTNLLQAKLTIGQPNNVYEQEADRVAAQIMAMPGPISRVQRQPESSTVNPSDVDDDIDPAMSRHLMEGAENLNREEALDSALSQLSPSILESALLSRPLFPGLGDLHLSNGLDEGNSPRAGHTRNAPRLTGLPALSLDRGFEEEYIRSGKLEKDFIKFLVSQAGLIGSIVRAITRDFRRNRPAGYALLAVGAAPIAAALAVNPSTLKRFGPLISSLLLPTGLPWARVQPIFDPKSENFGMVVHFDVLRIFTGQDSQTSSNPVDQNSLPRRPADPQEPLRHPSSPGEAARMNFSEGPMQAQGENDEPGAQVQRSPDQAQPASPQPDLENRLNASRSGGSPLPNEVRQFMEPRFGFDFSKVKVHNDADAVQMNRDLGAQAFAHGNHIYYGAGKAPANDHLTGHELTHVVQQIAQTPKVLNLQRNCAETRRVEEIQLREITDGNPQTTSPSSIEESQATNSDPALDLNFIPEPNLSGSERQIIDEVGVLLDTVSALFMKATLIIESTGRNIQFLERFDSGLNYLSLISTTITMIQEIIDNAEAYTSGEIGVITYSVRSYRSIAMALVRAIPFGSELFRGDIERIDSIRDKALEIYETLSPNEQERIRWAYELVQW